MFLTDSGITSYILPIVLGIGIGLLFAFRRNSKSLKITYLTPEDFRSNMRKGQLVDIRTKEEFSKERINGSRNYPNRDIFQYLHLFRADQPVFLYANTDKGTVKRVAKKLLKKGFKPVYVLVGGLDNWPFVKK